MEDTSPCEHQLAFGLPPFLSPGEERVMDEVIKGNMDEFCTDIFSANGIKDSGLFSEFPEEATDSFQPLTELDVLMQFQPSPSTSQNLLDDVCESQPSPSIPQNLLDAVCGSQPSPSTSQNLLDGMMGSQPSPSTSQNLLDAMMGSQPSPSPPQNLLDAMMGSQPSPLISQNLLDAVFKSQPSPSTSQNLLDAMMGSQPSPSPPQTLPSATKLPPCQEGSSVISVVGEGAVAGVNGVVPDEELSLVGLDCIDAFEGVPSSAKMSQAFVGAAEGKTDLPMCLKSAKRSSLTFTKASGVKKIKMDMPISAKTGSQAFNYIEETAILETHGIPASHHLTSPSQPIPSTHKAEKTGVALGPILRLPEKVAALRIDSKNITVPECRIGYTLHPVNKLGTVEVDPKQNTVPVTPTAKGLCLSEQPGTLEIEPTKSTVPQKLTDISTHNLFPSGTLKINATKSTVPQKPMEISTYNLDPSGTLKIEPTKSIVPQKPTEISTYNLVPSGTLKIDTTKSTVPNGGTGSTHKDLSGNRKKQRQRRKRTKEPQTSKVPMYKQGPQEDAIAERKRKDAIRAKTGREKNKKKMEDLQQKLDTEEEKRKEAEDENERLRSEVKGRRSWEAALLSWLRAERGITVAPYGTTPGQGRTQLVTSSRPLVTSIGKLSP